MPAATTLAVVGLSLAAAGTAYQVAETNKARRTAEEQSKRQMEDAAAKENDMKRRVADEEARALANQERMRMATSRSGRYGRGLGRNSTVLTSPLGLTTGGTGVGKGLIGE